MQPCCSSRIKTLERLVYVRHRSLPGHSRHHFFAQVGSTSNERISICDRTHPPLYDFLHGRKLFVQHVLDSYGEIRQVTTQLGDGHAEQVPQNPTPDSLNDNTLPYARIGGWVVGSPHLYDPECTIG